MRRILFVDNSTRCFYIFRLAVAKAFLNLGYEVFLVSPGPYDVFLDEIIKCGIKHVPYKLSPKYSISQDVIFFFRLVGIYKKKSPDFIVHYTIKPNIYGSIAAGVLRIKSLSVVPGTGSAFQGETLVSKIIRILYKISFKFTKKVWVLNMDDYNSFLQYNIVNKNKLEVLPGEGVDVSFYKSSFEYKKKKPFVFLYMGRMLREKGVEYLANASALLQSKGVDSFEVHLLGLVDGLSTGVISEDQILKWEKDGLIKYLGSVIDVRKNIEISDCVVLPTFYGEGIPRSLMEASAMKRPILTTDNVGCRDIVENGINGILCKSQDVNDLAAKMLCMINLPEVELRKMGEEGRKIVLDKFEESVIVNRYITEVNRIFHNENQH